MAKYKYNDDGSVTKIENSQPQPTNHGGSNNNWGWGTKIILAILFWVIFFAIAKQCDHADNSGQPILNNTQNPIADMPEALYGKEESTVYSDYTEPSYIEISSSSASFDSDGGSYTFTVNSNTSWYIDTSTAGWGHLSTVSRNELILRIDANNSTESRTDFFVLSSGDKSVRVDIYQEGKPNTPNAIIESVWMTHSDYQNGENGMTIHVRFSTENLKDRLIYVKASFYYGDNLTPLHDVYGNNLVKTETSNPSFEFATFEDFKLFIPYKWLNMESGSETYDLSFDVSIYDINGSQLDIYENAQFQYYSR